MLACSQFNGAAMRSTILSLSARRFGAVAALILGLLLAACGGESGYGAGAMAAAQPATSPDGARKFAAAVPLSTQADIVWQKNSGDISIWQMNGATLVSGVGVGSVKPEWQIAATGDFNSDGKPDLVWQNTVTGGRVIWFMDGATLISGVSFAVVPTEWKIVGAGDFNGDGKPDLVWQNSNTGDRVIWFMNGTTLISGMSFGVVPTDWNIVGVGDFNGDGKPDIVWQRNTGDIAVWFMNGAVFTSGVGIGSVNPQWKIVGTGDFNSDGKADIVFLNTSFGGQAVWFMNGPNQIGSVSLGNVSTDWRIAGTLTKSTPPPPTNTAPTASAGAPQIVEVGATVTLDGSASTDPQNDPLTYLWALTSKPIGSAAVISGTTSVRPTLVPDIAGTYVASLVVNDGSLNSAPKTVTVTATSAALNYFGGTGRCTGTAANSGWCREPTLPIGGPPFFIDASRGWMNGSPGDFEGASGIYRTTDGGQTWTGHKTGAANFSSMNFADANNGIAITEDSVNAEGKRRQEIWGSNDGGQTWARRSTLPFAVTLEAGVETKRFSGPVFASTDGKRVVFNGFTDGDGLTSLDGGVTWTLTRFFAPVLTPGGTLWQISGTQVLRSTDLGLTYSSTTLAGGGTLESLAFFGDLNGWITALDASGNRSVWRTVNGGLNWTRTALTQPASPAHGGRLTTLGLDVAWLNRTDIASSMTSISTDGGATWRRVFPPATAVDPSRLRPVVPIAEATAWARGEGCNSVSLTRDGGATWTTIQGPEDSGIPVYFGNPCEPKLLWPGGSSMTPFIQVRDRWYRSADGGASWTQVLGLTSAQSVVVETPALWFFDSLRWTSFDVATQDGGRTWTKQAAFPRSTNYIPIFLRPRLQFNASGLLGWAVTDRSSFAMSRTTDGGQSWQRITMPAPANVNPIDFENADMHFADDRSGWIVRRRNTQFFTGAQPALWSTANGGLDWVLNPQPPIVANAVHFISATTGFLAGEAGTLAQTRDGGITWQLRATGVSTSLQRLYFFDPTLGFAVGEAGTLLRTTDGGSTWAQTAVPTTTRLNNVHFADARRGWIVGNAGTLLASTDGGATWTAQRSGTVIDLVHLFAIDASTAWVVDERGHTITTATGGRSP